MGNRRRKRSNSRARKAGLGFEPLESRLPFAVDYSLWESDLFYLPESERLAFIEPNAEWLAFEVGHAAAQELSPTYELNFAQQTSFAASLTPISVDSLILPEIEYWGPSAIGDSDSGPIDFADESWLFGVDASTYYIEDASILDTIPSVMSFANGLHPDLDLLSIPFSQPVFQIVDSALLWSTVPIPDPSVVFGLTFETLISPAILFRHGPTGSEFAVTGDVFPAVALDLDIFGYAFTEMPLETLNTPSITPMDDALSWQDHLIAELSNLKFHDWQSTPPSFGVVNHAVYLSSLSQIAQHIEHSASSLRRQPSNLLDSNSQLPVENATNTLRRAKRYHNDSNVGVVIPGNSDSIAIHHALAIYMLPPGMLPIGSEPVNGLTSNLRSNDANQHFIVQTALICEALKNDAAVRHETGGEDRPKDLREFNLVSFERSLGLGAVGFFVFVVQTRFRPPRSLRNYWAKCISQVYRPFNHWSSQES